jgi:hypothetical protein
MMKSNDMLRKLIKGPEPGRLFRVSIGVKKFLEKQRETIIGKCDEMMFSPMLCDEAQVVFR